MYIKLDYLTFSVEVTEISKYILPFSEEKHGQECGTNYQVLGEY